MSADDRTLTYLKQVMLDLHKTRRRLHEAEHRLTEPIAIIGMGCRYPGGVRSPEDLWQLVEEGRDAISPFPEDRGWDLDSGPPTDAGHRPALGGGFIDGVGDFDAEFFGVDEREACLMDPQQRLLLEISWEAFENAGIDPTALHESKTGVFVGVTVNLYEDLVSRASCQESANGYGVMGNALSMVSGGVAQMLGLKGPAVSLDAASASSAVALHVACQALRSGECKMALAGGVTVLSTPMLQLQFKSQGLVALSDDARCKSFADGANGAGISDGAGMVVLERFSDAQRFGHDALAVVRGSAVNHDGVGAHLSVPNGLSHANVMRDALRNAGLQPAQIDAVEGHGMGTILGDPVEVEALLATYGKGRDPARPIRLASVKSNLGHTVAAGGVTGVIKMTMAIRNGLLPKTLHIDQPTRHADWSSGAIELLSEPVQWKSTGEPRRAAVHSFGLSGTNVHIVLEEPVYETPTVKASEHRGAPEIIRFHDTAVPWPISGRGRGGLRRQAQELGAFISGGADLDPVDVGYSLGTSRPTLSHRAVVIRKGCRGQVEALEEIAKGGSGGEMVSGEVFAINDRPAFIFPDYVEPSMGLALLDSSPSFAAALGSCDEVFEAQLGWSVVSALHGDVGDLGRLEIAGPVVFSLQVAMAEMWRACGVHPLAVVGEEEGNLAAAYIAGALSLADATRAIAGGERSGRNLERCPRLRAIPHYSGKGRRIELTGPGSTHMETVRREALQFDAVANVLLSLGSQAFVVLGPRSELFMRLRQSLEEAAGSDGKAIVVESVQSEDEGAGRFLCSLARLWVAGAKVDWDRVFLGSGGRRIQLPTYAFDRRRHWIDDLVEWRGEGADASADCDCGS